MPTLVGSLQWDKLLFSTSSSARTLTGDERWLPGLLPISIAMAPSKGSMQSMLMVSTWEDFSTSNSGRVLVLSAFQVSVNLENGTVTGIENPVFLCAPLDFQ